MKKTGYTLIPHAADICIEVNARTLHRLFLDSAAALAGQMVRIKKAGKREYREIEVIAHDRHTLLIYWLQELLYHFYVHGLIYDDATVRSLTDKRLKVKVGFHRFRPGKHLALREIKAVTYHNVHIMRKDGGYTVQFVIDV